MSILGLIASSPFALLGLHLARIARRTGALPERLLAGCFLFIAGAVPPRMFAIDMATGGAGLTWAGFWCNAAANTFMAAGMVSLAAFAWKVFRPEDSWARRLVISFGVAMSLALAAQVTSLAASSGSGAGAVAFNGIGTLVVLWAFVECVLYARLMRKRLALGIADPVVANRFVLWAIWTGALALQGMVMLAIRVALLWTGVGALMAEGVALGAAWIAMVGAAKALLAVVAPTAVVAVVLSFTPPASYRRWLGAATH